MKHENLAAWDNGPNEHHDTSHVGTYRSCIGIVDEAGLGTSPNCFDVDGKAEARSEENDINRVHRVVGVLGILTSCATAVIGWRTWRRPWRQNRQVIRCSRTALITVGLTPVALIVVSAPVFSLYLLADWLFHFDPYA